MAIALGERKTLKSQLSKFRDFRGSTGTTADRDHNMSTESTLEENPISKQKSSNTNPIYPNLYKANKCIYYKTR